MAGVVHIILLVVSAGLATAQEYPSKPIRIVTSNVGGNSDFVARQIAQGISGPLGQPVVVDNRTSVLAAPAVLKEKPDGYALLLAGGALWVRPLLSKSPYDEKDFSPISLVSREVNVVSVHPSVPVKSIKELVALAKARPGELNYGSSGVGGGNHLAGELFKSMSGANIVAVNYKGSGPAINALIGGEVQMAIYDLGLVVPLMKSGRVRALAVTSADPSALVPDLPTVSASGVPGYEAVSMTGMWTPAKTPAAAIQRLNQEIVRVLRTAEAKQRFLGNGTEVVASSVEQFEAAVKADIAKLAKVIKEANIKVE